MQCVNTYRQHQPSADQVSSVFGTVQGHVCVCLLRRSQLVKELCTSDVEESKCRTVDIVAQARLLWHLLQSCQIQTIHRGTARDWNSCR